MALTVRYPDLLCFADTRRLSDASLFLCLCFRFDPDIDTDPNSNPDSDPDLAEHGPQRHPRAARPSGDAHLRR